MTSIGMKGGDIIFSERTFSWIAGYPLHIFNGMTLVTATQFFELKTTNEHMKSTVRILEKEKCNHAILYSSVIREIMNTKHHMPPIQTIISGGGPIYARDSQIVNMCCHRFVNIYGSTETHATSANILHRNEAMKDFDTGRPFPGMEMKVIRADGSLVAITETGEVCYRGVFGSTGYLRSEQDWYLENRITGNWYKTGDAGYVSKEGHLFVTGRITEVIAVDETMVLPCYIEGVFARHPCFENVVAFAIPDEILYEVPGVALTLKAGSAVKEIELLQFFVKERNVIQQNSIFESKCLPRKIFILERFPKLNSGKIARRTVKEMALKTMLTQTCSSD